MIAPRMKHPIPLGRWPRPGGRRRNRRTPGLFGRREVVALTATKALKFPTADDLELIGKALARAFDEVERSEWVVRRIVEAFHTGDVLDRPTLETVGALAEYLDVLDTYLGEMKTRHDELSGHLRQVMTMRAEVEHRERLAAEAVTS